MKLLLFCLALAGCSGHCSQSDASSAAVPGAICNPGGSICVRDATYFTCSHELSGLVRFRATCHPVTKAD